MKKKRNKLLIAIISLLILIFSYAILFFFSFFQYSITIDDNNVVFEDKVANTFNSIYTSDIEFDDIESYKVSENINIKILNTNLKNINVYEKSLRYYIPLDIVCTTLNYKINNNIISNDKTTIAFQNDNKCTINDKEYSMRGNLLTQDNQKYISISDIEYLFNLTAVFNFDTKEISLLNKLPELKINENNEPTSGKAALLRLEDFSAGYGALNSENQLKYKCIGSLLKSNNIKFHIAWVPRFKCPSQNIDNNLLENNSIENIGYINVLDYFINSGAKIGLHGYSHQTGNNTSLNGVELSFRDNNNEEDTRKVIINAIDTASYLNIPYDFFESPHYKASLKQKDIIEEYFQFIYEPRNIFIYNKIYKHNNNMYIPTPLGYVENSDTSTIEKLLKSPRPNQLSSLFYHPTIELEYINLNINNNDISLDYNNSPLYRIIYCLKTNNYLPIYITDLKE